MDFMLTVEALAHYVRGGITVFFIFWCCILYGYIKRNRMMRLLYFAALWMTVCHVKDVVFLVNQWKNSTRLDDTINLIDLLFLPLVCAFFLEATRPGFSTNRRLFLALGVQVLFVVVFLFFPIQPVLLTAYAFAYLMSLLTIVSVVVFALRYHGYISSNYSYTERIDVVWVLVACLVFFGLLFSYFFAFEQTTWFSELFYNLFSFVLWTFLFRWSMLHEVVLVPFPVAGREESADDACSTTLSQEEEAPKDYDDAYTFPLRLKRCMEKEKIYLNPKLTLGEVAISVGTNKTYLSDYFNNTLHTTFYEYINKYRVEEACSIIDHMTTEGRKSMVEVAEMSGFNSLSSFNRYFRKVKGVSPKTYYYENEKGTES